MTAFPPLTIPVTSTLQVPITSTLSEVLPAAVAPAAFNVRTMDSMGEDVPAA